MFSKIITNLKKIIFSILPIISLVLILSIIFKIELNIIIRFLSSSILIIFGLTLFTTGSEISLNIMGERFSSLLLKKKNLNLILILCLVLGTLITILEPEFLTLSSEAKGIPEGMLLFFTAFGIGFSLMIAIYQILKKINFKYALISGYLIIFLLLLITNFNIMPFAFDMSSITAGAISAPFILSFGVGFTKRRRNKVKDNSEFGILSICGIGPIIMILLLGIIFKPTIIYDADAILKRLDFLNTLWVNFYQVLISLSPLAFLYFIFTYKKVKYKQETKKIILGLLMVLIGITFFLTGGDAGYFKISYIIGTNMNKVSNLIIILVGGIFGYFISKIEPSLKILIDYVNKVTNGSIKAKFLETILCIGVALSVMLSIYRVLNGYSVIMFLLITYFLAILLAFFTPNNFTKIAFDSSGVVAGNMSSNFLVPLLVGIASNISNNYLQEAFGVLSLISIIPVIILEIVGLIYQKEYKEINLKELDTTIIDYK